MQKKRLIGFIKTQEVAVMWRSLRVLFHFRVFSLSFFMLFFALFHSLSSYAYEPAFGEFTQQLNGVEYKLKVKIQDVKFGDGVGQLHTFSIYRAGKFVHSSKWDGGRITGCRTFGPEGGMKDFFNATAIENNMSAVIWKISLTTWCGGNTSHLTDHYIVVSNNGNYHESTIEDFKWHVTYMSTEKSFAIYYMKQDWGGGGTSTSIFVPKKYVIEKSNWGIYGKKAQLTLNELINIPWNKDEQTGKVTQLSFPNLFQYCMDQQAPDICDYAVNNAFKEAELKWYKGYFGWQEERGPLTKIHFQKYTEMLKRKMEIDGEMKSLFSLN